MTNEKLTLATEKVASIKDNDVQFGIWYLHHILERLKVTEAKYIYLRSNLLVPPTC